MSMQVEAENAYIIGIDFGYRSSNVCYMDLKTLKPHLLDMSGGYGHTSIPSIVQYLEHSQEWLIGHEALLTEGTEGVHTFDHLLRLLKETKKIELGVELLRGTQIVSVFFSNILLRIMDINPKAVLKQIVVTLPQATYEDVGAKISEMFLEMGYDPGMFKIETNVESISSYLLNNPEMIQRNVMIADYAYRNLRCTLINIRAKGYKSFEAKVNTFALACDISGKTIQTALLNQIQQIIDLKIDDGNKKQKMLKVFYDNKNYMYSKIGVKKNIQLILNSVFPPVIIPIDLGEVENIVDEHYLEIKNMFAQLHQFENIEYIITLGMGFEIIKTKYSIEKELDIPVIQNTFAFAEGACRSGHNRMITGYQLTFNNICIIEHDYGVKAVIDGQEEFVVLIKKGQNWWEKGREALFVVDYSDAHNVIPLYKRGSETDPLEEVEYVRLPLQSKSNKMQQVQIALKFKDYRHYDIQVHEVINIF